jgi:hypothetical protein
MQTITTTSNHREDIMYRSRISAITASLLLSLMLLSACTRKGSPTEPSTPTLIGTWNVTSVDGKTPPAGKKVTFKFTATTATSTLSSDGTRCETVFSYVKDGDKLYLEVLSNDCADINVGDRDTMTYTLTGTTLTMVSNVDGTTIVTRRES